MASAYERLKGSLLFGSAIGQIEPPQPLIDGVIDTATTALIYGGSGVGKSFLALDWALSIAHGLPWFGRTTTPGCVLYVVAEGAAGTGPRLDAWASHYDIPITDSIVWLPVAPNILLLDQRTALIQLVEELNPTLTVLDTVARHIPGGDENSFQTMSMIVETLDAIKNVSGGCALGVHHAGKDTSAGARGHSSLKGALDSEFECAGKRIQGLQHMSVKVTKQKYRKDGHMLGRFRLVPHLDSLILAPDDTPIDTTLNQSETTALKALEGQLAYTEWQSASGLANSTLARVRQSLLQKGLIENFGTDLHPRWGRSTPTPD